MNWPRTFRPLLAMAFAIGLPLAAYFPLKSANPNFFLFFDAARCLTYMHAVAAWIFMAASVLAAGGLLVRLAARWGALPPGTEHDLIFAVCIRVGLGLGAHMLALFIMSAVGLLNLKFILPLNLIVLLAGAGELKRFARVALGRRQPTAADQSPMPIWTKVLLAVSITAALIPVWLMLGVPVAEWDEMVYQLTIPKQMLAAGGFVRQPYLFFFDWPLNLNLVYAEAMALGTYVTARYWHFALGLLTAALAARMAVRWAQSAAAGWLAAAIFLTIPVVQLELGVAMVDLGLAFFIVLAFDVWDRWMMAGRETPAAADRRTWSGGALAGVFLGLAAGVKYMGLYAAAAFVGIMMISWFFRESRRIWGWRSVLAMGLATAALFAPWAARTWIITGNPVFPQLYSLFGGADWSAEFARQWNEWIFRLGPGRGWSDLILLPWRLTFSSSPFYADFAGELNPYVFPATGLAVLFPSLWPRLHRPLLAAFLYLFLWFLTSQQMRFLIPCFALLAAVGATGLAAVLAPARRGQAWAGFAAAFIFASSWLLHPTPLSIADANFTVTFGQPQSVDDYGYMYHRRRVDNIKGVLALNRLMNGRGKALLYFENRGYYVERPYIADGAFEVSRIVDRLMAEPSPVSFTEWLRIEGVTHILWNQNFSEAESGEIVFRYYPEYRNKWKNFIADHAKIVYEELDIIILELSAGSPLHPGGDGAPRMDHE